MKKSINNKLSEKFSKAASTNSHRVHVVPGKDGWAVKKEGAKRATVIKRTKVGAVKAAINIKAAEIVVIHKKDGTIQKNTKRK